MTTIVDAPLTRAQARALTDRIRKGLGSTGALLRDGLIGHAWRALDYPTVAAWLDAEFGIRERQARYLMQRSVVEDALTEAAGGKKLPRLTLAQSTAVARDLDAVTAAVQAEPERVAEIVAAASHPASHPPLDGDRSTHPAPEVPPAPSSLSVAAATPEPFWLCERHPDAPVEWRHEIAYCGRCDRTSLDPRPESPDEEVMPSAAGPAAPEDDTPPAAEPSEPGVAGAAIETHRHRWSVQATIGVPGWAMCSICGERRAMSEDDGFPPPPVCTDPAHADPKYVVFDTDGVLTCGTNRCEPRPGIQFLVDTLACLGYDLIAWSAGGAEHARDHVERSGLHGTIRGYASKPEYPMAEAEALAALKLTGPPALQIDDDGRERVGAWPFFLVETYVPSFVTQPAHADMLSLIRDLDRLLLPRDEEDWRAWDLGDQEAEGRALMARVRSLLGDAGTAQDAPEETPSPDPRIPAIRARLEALSAKQRAAFCRVHNVGADALGRWVAGLNDGELDTACAELGLTGAEVP